MSEQPVAAKPRAEQRDQQPKGPKPKRKYGYGNYDIRFKTVRTVPENGQPAEQINAQISDNVREALNLLDECRRRGEPSALYGTNMSRGFVKALMLIAHEPGTRLVGVWYPTERGGKFLTALFYLTPKIEGLSYGELQDELVGYETEWSHVGAKGQRDRAKFALAGTPTGAMVVR